MKVQWMVDPLKILFFYKCVDPNIRNLFSFPYALDKHADVIYYGTQGVFTIEENPTDNSYPWQPNGHQINSYPWQTYGHRVGHGRLSESDDALEIIKKLYPKDYPDVVITTFRPTTTWVPKNIEKCKCLRVVWCIELHNDFSHSRLGRKRLQWCKEKTFNLVFKPHDPNNLLQQSKWLEETGVAVEMNPLSINTDFFYDKQLEKKYDVTNIFARLSPKTYPLRWKIHETIPKQKQWIYQESHDTWNKGIKTYRESGRPGGPRGEEYVNEICRSRVFATGSGRHKDTGVLVMKWLEVPACNTLLMINALSPTDDMNYMGFKPDVNFVAINEGNFLERIQYYLSHPSEAKIIAQSGYDLIRSKHSQDIRAQQFISKIRKYI